MPRKKGRLKKSSIYSKSKEMFNSSSELATPETTGRLSTRWGGGGGGETRPGTEKRCSHNLQSDPLGSGFKKGRENFLQ